MKKMYVLMMNVYDNKALGADAMRCQAIIMAGFNRDDMEILRDTMDSENEQEDRDKRWGTNTTRVFEILETWLEFPRSEEVIPCGEDQARQERLSGCQ